MKSTQDNLRAFEALLESAHELPLDESVGQVVDFCFETYTSNKRVPRAVLKVAHTIGLMPTLAQSQTVFAESLAASLRKRQDIGVPDIDLAAWTVTQAMMGVIQTLVWQDEPKHSETELRAELIALFGAHLRGRV